MNDADTLRSYIKFQAAHAITNASSATDVGLIDTPYAKEAEDIVTTWVGAPGTRLVIEYREQPRLVEHVWPVRFEWEDEANLFANMGDFATLDVLRTPEGQIRWQIRSVRGVPRLMYRERLARRLEFLVDTMKEDGESWNEDSHESLRTMLLFLQTVPHFRYPVVTVTPSATFRAQWTVGSTRHFAVDFLPDGQVRFVVFCPDPLHPNRVQRVSGIASWENLSSVVEPYKVHRWTADAGA